MHLPRAGLAAQRGCAEGGGRLPRMRVVVSACVALLAACSAFGTATNTEPAPPSTEVDASDAARASDTSPEMPDASPLDADTGTEPSGPCIGVAACARYVFVTSEVYTGEDLGGAIAADGKCTVRASAASTLPALAGREWQAWLSDDVAQASASARLTHGTRPYRLANGSLVANDWTQLTSGALLHAIDVDEQGRVLGQEFVWTGTTAFGQATPQTCTNWTLNGASNYGTVGQASAKDSTWTNSGAVTCGSGHRLYCVEK